VYGIVRLEQQGSWQRKTVVFEPYLTGRAIDFESDIEKLDIEDYREEFEPLATGDSPFEDFKDVMAPALKRVGNWPLAFDLGAAWLFAAPRLAPEEGSIHRGDIHMGLFGPPGIGKSIFLDALAELSPDAEHRSATGLSSDVGLIAAATQDDFAEGDGWTLKPGILARAGSHAIIDEIDKTDAKLSKMNDALEGRQLATVDKGGIKADLKTRVGVLVAGNPDGGRWEDLEYVSVKEQIDIGESLWSRLDGTVVLQDTPDAKTDGEVADHMLRQHRADAARVAESNGRVPPDAREALVSDKEGTSRPISDEAARAWVMAGREINPLLTDTAKEKLRDFFIEVRNGLPSGDGFTATPRKLTTGIRFAKAFARLRLSPTVEEPDAEMAVSLGRRIVGQTYTDDGADNDQTTEAQSAAQSKRLGELKSYVRELETEQSGAAKPAVVSGLKDKLGASGKTIREDIEKLLQKGELREPQTDSLRVN
jgi:replicative DNA helicase Mcm